MQKWTRPHERQRGATNESPSERLDSDNADEPLCHGPERSEWVMRPKAEVSGGGVRAGIAEGASEASDASGWSNERSRDSIGVAAVWAGRNQIASGNRVGDGRVCVRAI